MPFDLRRLRDDCDFACSRTVERVRQQRVEMLFIASPSYPARYPDATAYVCDVAYNYEIRVRLYEFSFIRALLFINLPRADC